MAEDRKLLEYWGFSVITEIGRGGNGVVYAVSRRCDHKQFALKVLDMKDKPGGRNPESTIWPKLKHQNIVPLFDAIQYQSKFYYLMPVARKGNLHDRIFQHGPVDQGTSRYWCRGLFNAVQYLHAQNIAHRDITCGNIFIFSQNHIKLGDLGSSCQCQPRGKIGYRRATVVGCQQYMSPAMLNESAYDPKAVDIWAMGVTFYVIHYGKYPFSCESEATMYEEQCARRIRLNDGKLCREGNKLILDMLHPDESKRITAAQMSSNEWLTGRKNFN